MEIGFMKLISAYMDLFIHGEKVWGGTGGKCPDIRINSLRRWSTRETFDLL